MSLGIVEWRPCDCGKRTRSIVQTRREPLHPLTRKKDGRGRTRFWPAFGRWCTGRPKGRMTSEDFPTVQVDISNIRKDIVGSRHKKGYCFVCFGGYFLMCGFKQFRLVSGFVAKDDSELLVSCLYFPSVEIPDVCHYAQPKRLLRSGIAFQCFRAF